MKNKEGFQMKRIAPAAFFAALFILAMLIAVSGCTDKTKNQEERNFTIISDNTCWSPAMSSIIGIDMTPEYTGDGDYVFHWTATGESGPKVQFNSWGSETNGRIIKKGNDTWTNPGETVWWYYGNFEPETMPEKFTLKVEAVDKKTNETTAETEVKITRKVMVFCIDTA